MGKNSIERGSRDSWTPTPRRRDRRAGGARRRPRGGRGGAAGRRRGGRRAAAGAAAAARPSCHRSCCAIRRCAIRAASSCRPTSRTSRRRRSSSTRCSRPASPCTARPRRSRWPASSYPAGSYVVKTAQAFRPHVLDMFEPQDHPDDIPYPGGPPTRPYDNAGWTLAYQMGVQVRPHPRRLRRAVREAQRAAEAAAGHGRRRRQPPATCSSHAVERRRSSPSTACWRPATRCQWLTTGPAPGYVLHRRKGATVGRVVQKIAAGPRAVTSRRRRRARPGTRSRCASSRIALADQYGGSMPSGWTRLDPRAVRVPVRGRVSAGARRRQPVARSTT